MPSRALRGHPIPAPVCDLMCGRFTLRTPAAILKDYFGLPDLPGFAPRYNIAPTQPVGTVRQRQGAVAWDELRWGLVPEWADDPGIGSRMINARAETLATRSAFRDALRLRRCVVAADGFYEWQPRDDGSKQPYYIADSDDNPFAFAALWDRWRHRDTGVVIESCAIVTTAPNELMAPIHDRMPAVLDQEGVAEWLRPDNEPDALAVLLQPYPSERLRATPVSTHVNKPVNDDARCIEPAEAQPEARRLF